MSNSSSSSHVPWQGSARWKQGWRGSWKGWDDTSATTSPVSEQVSDEHAMTALHAMQEHMQQTSVIFPKVPTEKALLTIDSKNQSVMLPRGQGGPHPSS